MSYLDRIRHCTAHDLAGFRPWRIGPAVVGWVRHELARRLAGFPQVFTVSWDGVALSDRLSDFASRSAAVGEVAERLTAAGALPKARGELYAVATGWGAPPFLTMDRAAAYAFGVKDYGPHVNGLVETPDGLEVWVAERAADRQLAPGKLDNLVAGGQPHGTTLADNLVKEAGEEASIPPDLAATARPVGLIRYAMEVPEGLRRGTAFLYDLHFPADFVPRNTDGEIARFERWPVARVAARLRETDDFKFDVALVNIDLLVRRGLIRPEDPDYVAIVAGLRSPIDFPA